MKVKLENSCIQQIFNECQLCSRYPFSLRILVHKVEMACFRWVWYTISIHYSEATSDLLERFILPFSDCHTSQYQKAAGNRGVRGIGVRLVRARCPLEQPMAAYPPRRARTTPRGEPKPQACRGSTSGAKDKVRVALGVTRPSLVRQSEANGLQTGY